MDKEKVETLKTIDGYIDNLISGIEEVAELLQEGNEIIGIKKIIELIEGIEYISKGILLTKDIHKEEIELKELNIQLNEIVEAFENEDYVLLGDLFNYELIPVVKSLQDKIKKSI